MAQLLNVIAYVLGATGTALLFFYSYRLPPSIYNFFMSAVQSRHTSLQYDIRNRRLLRRQRLGFALLTISFLMLIVAAFIPTDWGT